MNRLERARIARDRLYEMASSMAIVAGTLFKQSEEVHRQATTIGTSKYCGSMSRVDLRRRKAAFAKSRELFVKGQMARKREGILDDRRKRIAKFCIEENARQMSARYELQSA